MKRYGHEIRLYQAMGDDPGNDEHQDRIVCTHIFHGKALPDGAGGTMTFPDDPEKKVWPWQLCQVCRGLWFGT